ncbi:hypothetical protein BJV77DRAFT_219538 [Russula vinacea]|nr:hypothetical protein BJV77DRAFT_219538 [Russula vinacea]
MVLSSEQFPEASVPIPLPPGLSDENLGDSPAGDQIRANRSTTGRPVSDQEDFLGRTNPPFDQGNGNDLHHANLFTTSSYGQLSCVSPQQLEGTHPFGHHLDRRVEALELGEFQWIPETGIAPSSDDRIRGSREWPCHHVGCNKSYGRRQEAIRHTRDKHEFSRTCFICDIKWTRADMIRKHLLFKHRHHFTEEELREIRQLQGLNNTIELLKRLEISKALEK